VTDDQNPPYELRTTPTVRRALAERRVSRFLRRVVQGFIEWSVPGLGRVVC
jgi:hypothetical protein